MKLIVKILIAIALGIGAGYVLPDWIARIFLTFNAIFSEYLEFIVPLLIIAFVAPTISTLGNRAGKMVLWTLIISYIFTIGTGFFTYGVSSSLFPSLITVAPVVSTADPGAQLDPYFVFEMPAIMDVCSALVLAFILGIGAASVGSQSILNGLNGFGEIIKLAINKTIIPLFPLYIFGVFMNMTINGETANMMSTFLKAVIVIFILHVLVLVIQYCIAGGITHHNPFKSLWAMMPAYFTALGTSSSAATIPVTLKSAVKMGVNPDIAGFTVPLCATVHMSGSTMKIVACSMALMIAHGHDINIAMYAGLITTLAITIIAAPGVPGGAIMASIGLLQSILGFSDTECALMIALYISMDSFGTACNVTGDGSIAQIIDYFFGPKKGEDSTQLEPQPQQ